MSKCGGRKNFGYGRQLSFAVNNIIDDKYGPGRFSTRTTYKSRMNRFIKFLRRHGINDLTTINELTIRRFVDETHDCIAEELLSATTATHCISAVNVALEHARKDDHLFVSPSKTFGRRCHVRTTAPLSLHVLSLSQLTSGAHMRRQHGLALSITMGLCRFAGMRFEEASKAPLKEALSELCRDGTYNVVHGTKGGRRVERRVPCSSALLTTMDHATRSLDSQYVIPMHSNYAEWRRFAYREMPKIAADLSLATGFHDFRASYACDRYREITGFDAPVVAGKRLAPKELDGAARDQLSLELGHSRRQITASYVGSAR